MAVVDSSSSSSEEERWEEEVREEILRLLAQPEPELIVDTPYGGVDVLTP